MQSLNQTAELTSLQKEICRLSAVTPETYVLDLGCGNGKTLVPLLKLARRIVGVDADEKSLSVARDTHRDSLESGQLELIAYDIAAGLCFPDAQFDIIICQNVLECIEDNVGLLRECRRVLKHGGILFLSHHDFSGIIMNSGYPELTRELIHKYANHAQDWMPHADGAIGRKLPGLVAKANFRMAETKTVPLVELNFSGDGYAHGYVRQLQTLRTAMQISSDSMNSWVADLRRLDEMQEFYFCLPWVYVKAGV